MNISQNKYYQLAFAMMRVSKELNTVSEMLGEDDELNEYVAGLNQSHRGLNLLPMSCDEFASVWATACYEAESRALQYEQAKAAEPAPIASGVPFDGRKS